jgi:NAD(P)-dependent dehydrogenase (short-subunit alcohol dehydrogenase family)
LRRNDFDVIVGANEASGPEAADKAVATIKAAVPFMDEPDAPRILVLPLDLARPTSVEDFATRVTAITPGVHWLFLNAAVGDVASSMWGSKPVLTAEGHERTVAVNYFGHYLLCRHLLKALTYAAPSRVVSVSCSRHMHAWRLDHTNWQLLNPAPWWQPVHFKAGDAYNNSKVRRRKQQGSGRLLCPRC